MFATIYLPNFYLQAAMRHQPELRAKPVALIEEQERKPLIIQLNEAAEEAGICKGMTPSQALARCLQIIIKTRARSQEKSIQEILLHHAFTLSPFVENTAPAICTVQFTNWHRHPTDNRLAGRQCHEKCLAGHRTTKQMRHHRSGRHRLIARCKSPCRPFSAPRFAN